MKRALAGMTAWIIFCSGIQAQPVFQQLPIQIAPAIPPQFPLEPGPGGQPGTGKPREEVKIDPKTNPDPKSLEIPEETLKKAESLVQLLGSPNYKDRESATRDLQKMGRAAIKALQNARDNESNAEIRLRTEMVLPAAEADDMRAKVACFLADVDAKYDHSLPGWNKFKEVVGNDKPARELFAEVLKMQDMNDLLLASELPPNELSQVLNNHFINIQRRMNGQFVGKRGGISNAQPSTAEIIVLGFLESVYDDNQVVMNYNYGYSITNYLYQPDIQNSMMNRGNSKYAPIIRKVMTRWLETRVSGQGAQMAMNFAQNWQMNKDIPKYAARVLEAETFQQNWWAKINALTVIAQRSEAKQYLPSIMKVFDDNTVIQQPFPGAAPQQANTITLGDFAFGIALTITGQAHKDYDMGTLNNSYKYSQNNYFFKDEEKSKAEDKRKAAMKKWDAWYKDYLKTVKEQPKTETPMEPKPETPPEKPGRRPIRGGVGIPAPAPVPLPAPLPPIEKQ